MKSFRFRVFQLCLLALIVNCVTTANAKDKVWAFAGTYTSGDSKGIYVLQLDLQTGRLEKRSVVASENPSFVAICPDGDFVYAVNEVNKFRGEKAGAVSAFAFDLKSATLKLLNQQSYRGLFTR